MTEKKEFLNYIHLFRGLAIVVIVGIHCRISFVWDDRFELSKSIFTTLLDNGTVLFVFIAGFLFQYLRRNYQFTSYFKRKMMFVVLPYILVSIPILIYKLGKGTQTYEWLPEHLHSSSYAFNTILLLATGKHIGPFWFIPMIFIFYLISPLLIRLDNSRFYTYFFPVLFILGLFTYRFGYYSNTVDSFIHYVPIYIFGMWGSAYRAQLTQLKMQWVWVLFISYAVIATLEVTGVLHILKLNSFESARVLPYFHFNWAKLKVSLLCVLLIRVFYTFNQREIPVLKKLADDSFGIFFIHMYVIAAFTLALNKWYADFELNLFTFLIYTLLVTVVSLVIIEVLKKLIGKNSRMVIGT